VLHGMDIAMAVLLALSVLVGLWRGLVFELMSLVGWLVAYIAALAFSGQVGVYLPVGEPGSALNHAASLVVTFVGALLLWSFLARLLRMVVAATPLTFIDRALGGTFGGLRGLVLLLLMVTAINLTPTGKSAWWNESLGVQLLGVIIEGLRPHMPQGIARWLLPLRQKV
jgi:membrane protein required for colicin V production